MAENTAVGPVPPAPLLVPKSEVERLTGISQRSIDRLVSAGKFLKPIRLGGRVMWNRECLSEWVRNGCPPVVEATLVSE